MGTDILIAFIIVWIGILVYKGSQSGCGLLLIFVFVFFLVKACVDLEEQDRKAEQWRKEWKEKHPLSSSKITE